MKTSFALLAACLVFSSTVFAAPDGYVDPITFDGSDAQKTQVINFIKKNVDTAYCKGLGQCSATLLRMMEEAQLKSFKNLAKTAREHQKEYKQVYKDYCVGIGQCDYSTLEMMFKEEVKNASKQLTW